MSPSWRLVTMALVMSLLLVTTQGSQETVGDYGEENSGDNGILSKVKNTVSAVVDVAKTGFGAPLNYAGWVIKLGYASGVSLANKANLLGSESNVEPSNIDEDEQENQSETDDEKTDELAGKTTVDPSLNKPTNADITELPKDLPWWSRATNGALDAENWMQKNPKLSWTIGGILAVLIPVAIGVGIYYSSGNGTIIDDAIRTTSTAAGLLGASNELLLIGGVSLGLMVIVGIAIYFWYKKFKTHSKKDVGATSSTAGTDAIGSKALSSIGRSPVTKSGKTSSPGSQSPSAALKAGSSTKVSPGFTQAGKSFVPKRAVASSPRPVKSSTPSSIKPGGSKMPAPGAIKTTKPSVVSSKASGARK